MIKTVNRIIRTLLIISVVYCFLAYNDIDRWFLWPEEIMLGVTVFVGLLLSIRMTLRWKSYSAISKRQVDVIFQCSISSAYKKRILLYEVLYATFYAFVGVLLVAWVFPAFYFGLILLFFSLESYLFFILNKNRFQLALTKNVVVVATNEPNLIRLNRLESVLNKDTNYEFKNKDSRSFKVESYWMEEEDLAVFNSTLTDLMKEKGVFIDTFNKS